jgi:uncharacterized membrane protein
LQKPFLEKKSPGKRTIAPQKPFLKKKSPGKRTNAQQNLFLKEKPWEKNFWFFHKNSRIYNCFLAELVLEKVFLWQNGMKKNTGKNFGILQAIC